MKPLSQLVCWTCKLYRTFRNFNLTQVFHIFFCNFEQLKRYVVVKSDYTLPLHSSLLLISFHQKGQNYEILCSTIQRSCLLLKIRVNPKTIFRKVIHNFWKTLCAEFISVDYWSKVERYNAYNTFGKISKNTHSQISAVKTYRIL